MIVYEINGEIIAKPEILHQGKDFFRKITMSKREKDICAFLQTHPHTNIVTIYQVGEDYIDMELLNVDMSGQEVEEVMDVMEGVKTYLQSVGIMYIDWKMDNIGISEDGQMKLFDFDVSGIIHLETNEWINKPPSFWSYSRSIQHGMETPMDIDNYAFEAGFQAS